jgi:hypothetical protein
VLHEVYIPRIQRGKAYFAANVLEASGALLSVLYHFFAAISSGTSSASSSPSIDR